MAGRPKLLRRPSLVDQPGHLLWPINIRDGAGERCHLHADHPGAHARRTPPCAATRHPRDRRPLPRDARGARSRRRRLVGRRGGRPVAVPIRSVPRPGRLVPRAWTQPPPRARGVSPHRRNAGSVPRARAAPWRPTGPLRHDRPWRERGRAPLRPRADTRALGGAHAPAPVACLAAKSAGRRDGVGQRLRAPLLSASRRRRRPAGRCGRAFGPDRAAPLPARGSARRVARRGGRGDGRERLAARAPLWQRGWDSLRAAARRPARARYGAAGTGGPRAAGALPPHAVPRRAPPAVATARLAPCRRPRAGGRPGERLSRRVGDPGPPRRARQPHRGSHRGAARGEHTPSRRADPHGGRDARDAGGARPSDPGGPRRAAVLAAGSAGSGGMTSLASSLSARRGTPEWDAVLRLSVCDAVRERADLEGAPRRVRADADGGWTPLSPSARHGACRRRQPLHGLRELPCVRRHHAPSAARAGAELLDRPEDARVVPAEPFLRRVVVRLEPDSVLDRFGLGTALALLDAEISVRNLSWARAPSVVLRDAGARDSRVYPGPRDVRDRSGRDRRGGGAARSAASPVSEERMLMLALLLCADTARAFPLVLSPAESVEVTVAGSGEPVVLIPGLFGSAFGYRAVIPLLTDAGYRAIVVEPLGIGSSARPEHADYSLTAQADRI